MKTACNCPNARVVMFDLILTSHWWAPLCLYGVEEANCHVAFLEHEVKLVTSWRRIDARHLLELDLLLACGRSKLPLEESDDNYLLMR